MKGQIIDIYPEGSETYRACVLHDYEDFVAVIDLTSGMIFDVSLEECSAPLIMDIFNLKGIDNET